MDRELDRPFLKGENIYLRAIDVDDIDNGYLQWVNNHEIIKYLETGRFPKSRKDLIDYIENCH